MGKYIGPKNKIARRFGVNLGLKTNATKVARRLNQRPGAHGTKYRRGNLSSYGKQLAEKQKAKYMYNVREKQFRKYVEEANRHEGDSGVNLQQLLERRMDNAVYRLGFAGTRAQARQMVNHGMFTLNGKKMTIPSHRVKVGDEIAIKETKAKKKIFDGLDERMGNHECPSWLSYDIKARAGKVTGMPTVDDFEKIFDVKLIIEYFATR